MPKTTEILLLKPFNCLTGAILYCTLAPTHLIIIFIFISLHYGLLHKETAWPSYGTKSKYSTLRNNGNTVLKPIIELLDFFQFEYCFLHELVYARLSLMAYQLEYTLGADYNELLVNALSKSDSLGQKEIKVIEIRDTHMLEQLYFEIHTIHKPFGNETNLHEYIIKPMLSLIVHLQNHFVAILAPSELRHFTLGLTSLTSTEILVTDGRALGIEELFLSLLLNSTTRWRLGSKNPQTPSLMPVLYILVRILGTSGLMVSGY
ncbi:hypothetical protein AGLY_016020 [Aphis glycines]|uniref:Uncharacterized protein n=1 Tax=Aphis glycines TaxID=307491 RepID=A0A6G0SZ88_APHGL|nr:hypothetical protein AGLY_016020 [Aphis glycines]